MYSAKVLARGRFLSNLEETRIVYQAKNRHGQTDKRERKTDRYMDKDTQKQNDID